MSAATIHHPRPATPIVARLSPADVYGLERPAARRLAELPTDARRAAATRAAADRRAALALYVDLYAERYGHRLNLSAVEAGDDLLAELLILAIA